MARQLRREPKKGFVNSNPNAKKPRLADMFDLLPFPKKKGDWLTLRLVGDITSYAQHWIEIQSEKKGTIKFPKECLSWDAETESHDTTKKCPYCVLGNDPQIAYYSNAIIRDLQERPPRTIEPPTPEEDTSGFKDMSSDTWTPVKVVRIPPTLASKFKARAALNTRISKRTKKKTAYDLSDPKYGMDVHVSYDPDGKGANVYDVEKGDRTPLTEEEYDYLIYKLAGVIKPETYEEAKKEINRLKERGSLPDDPNGKDTETYNVKDVDDGGYDSDNDSLFTGYDEEIKPKSNKKTKVKPSYDEEEAGYEGLEANYDYDIEEADVPKKKPKSSKNKPKEEEYEEDTQVGLANYDGDGTSIYDIDDDNTIDSVDYDGALDDPNPHKLPPRSESKSKRKSTRSKPVPTTIDDYEGEMADLSDIDEPEEPPKKKRSSKRTTSKSSTTHTRSRSRS